MSLPTPWSLLILVAASTLCCLGRRRVGENHGVDVRIHCVPGLVSEGPYDARRGGAVTGPSQPDVRPWRFLDDAARGGAVLQQPEDVSVSSYRTDPSLVQQSLAAVNLDVAALE